MGQLEYPIAPLVAIKGARVATIADRETHAVEGRSEFGLSLDDPAIHLDEEHADVLRALAQEALEGLSTLHQAGIPKDLLVFKAHMRRVFVDAKMSPNSLDRFRS